MTFKTLGQDYRIKSSGEGYYDLDFHGNDLKIVKNKESLINGLIFRCMTRYGEIKNPTYSMFGNHAYEEIKDGNTQLAREMIKEDFKTVITQSHRVKSLDLIRVDINMVNGMMGVMVSFSITALDDTTASGKVVLV